LISGKEVAEAASRRKLAEKYLDLSQQVFRQRIDLKQKVVQSYLLGTVGLISFVFKNGLANPVGVELLVGVPVFAMTAAILFTDHMLVTTAVVRYQLEILAKHLDPDPSGPEALVYLDVAPQVLDVKSHFRLFHLGEITLFGMIPLACLVFVGWRTRIDFFSVGELVNGLRIGFLVIGLFCLVVAILTLRRIPRATAVFGPKLTLG
jgi:hypothetical protein